ncbi:MAG: copper chaperone PCu(A)C [Caulobacteraceae bacterium]
MRTIAGVVFSLALAGTAQAQATRAGPLTLDGLQLRATPAGLPTPAAYLTIENHGKTADKLVDITCACAASAMMHRSETKNGVSAMSMVGEVEIPAGGKVSFTPNGLHVMLVGLKKPLTAGRTEVMTLRFQKAGKVKASFRVVDVIGN